MGKQINHKVPSTPPPPRSACLSTAALLIVQSYCSRTSSRCNCCYCYITDKIRTLNEISVVARVARKQEIRRHCKKSHFSTEAQCILSPTLGSEFIYQICPHSMIIISASNCVCINTTTQRMIFKQCPASIESNSGISRPGHGSTQVRENCIALCSIGNYHCLVGVGLY